MAVASVTGTLADFGRGNLADRQPLLIFTPEGPTTTLDGYLLSAVPLTCTPAASGAWAIGLVPADDMTERRGYSLQIQLLDPVAGYVYIDFPDWLLYVPAEGGSLPVIINSPLHSGQVWEVAGGAIPSIALPGDLLLDTTTSDLYRIGLDN